MSKRTENADVKQATCVLSHRGDAHEARRLDALEQTGLMDTQPESVFDDITLLTKHIFDVEVVLISLVDDHRQWFKSKIGIDVEQTPRDISFCQYAIQSDDPFIVEDTHESEQFKDNPLVTGAPFIRFYSGIPLKTVTGYNIGTLCIIDSKPRKMPQSDIFIQQSLAKIAERAITQKMQNHQALSGFFDDELARLVSRCQGIFLKTDDEKLTLNKLLDETLSYTHSSFGFFAEVMQTRDNKPYLLMHAITNLSWDASTQALFEKQQENGFEFYDLDNLLGESVQSGLPTIAHDIKNDPRAKGFPKGHPDLTNFMSMPIYINEDLVGIIGLANRENGFSDDYAQKLIPLSNLSGILIQRGKHKRQAREHREQLFEAAHLDVLTGLPNRRLLSRHLEELITENQKTQLEFSLCYFDLDGFKEVNDTLGHSVGDELLSAISQRLKNLLREDDFLCRISGDEFVVVLLNVKSERIYQKIIDEIGKSFDLSDNTVKVSASMGVVRYPDDFSEADMLIRHADQAMYASKEKGKNQFTIFDVDKITEKNLHQQFLDKFIGALQNDEIHLYLQPKIDLSNDSIIGFEVLCRWHESNGSVLQPYQFLPQIENTCGAIKLDEYILKKSHKLVKVLLDINPKLSLNVNISGDYFDSEGFSEFLDSQVDNLEEARARESIVLEIVESTTLGDLDTAINTLRKCRQLGYRISLDDFGTSYSSLTYFRKLPIDEVKIDRSFVTDILTDPQDASIIKAIVDMAHSFKRSVVAEGVEELAQAELLREYGCELAQGYYYGKPMPIEYSLKLLENN